MTTNLNVILVEDSDDDAILVTRQLKQGGYEPNIHRVQTAPDLRTALDEAHWDVILSDYALPGFSGLSALLILYEKGLDIPFILVSGTIGEDAAVEAMKAGAHDYVMKGNLFRLVPAVQRELREAAQRRQRKRARMIQAATYRISESASSAKNLEEMFQSIHLIISELMPAHNFYIALYDAATNRLSFPYFVDLYETPPEPQVPGKGLTEYVLNTGRPMLATAQCCLELEAAGEIELVGAPSVDWLGVPLKSNGTIIGVLVVQTYEEGINYHDDDKEILVFVSTQVAMAITRKQSDNALRESVSRYRSLFEHSPISLWEEDFSAIKNYIDQLRLESPNCNFRSYFESQPEIIASLMSTIEVIDVNQATVKMYEAATKKDLLGRLEYTQYNEALEIFKEELIAIAEGKQEFEGTGVNRKLTGNPIDIILRWTISPEYSDTLSRIIVSVVDITERKQAERQLQAQLFRLDALRTVDMAITASMDLRVTLDVLLDQVVTQLHMDAADILTISPYTKILEYTAGRGFRSSGMSRTRMSVSEGHAGKVALERRLISIPDLSKSPDFARARMATDEDFVAYYGVPLVAKGQVKGVLEVYHRSPVSPSPDWIDFLETMAGQAAIAIDNATLFENLQRSNIELALAYDATIEGWSRALDLRDKETEGHTERVTEMTLLLAERMGLTEEERMHIRRGALLHDIGKMGISDSILLKSGPLSGDKWEIMRKHPLYAYELLSPISYLQPSLDIPYCHHEKWDGSGYPRGLKGEQIPLSARIFAVVDVYDALRSDRPYRAAWPEGEVSAFIRSQSGKHFDPNITKLFLEMLQNGEL